MRYSVKEVFEMPRLEALNIKVSLMKETINDI